MYNCRPPLFVSYPTFVSYAVGSSRRPSSSMQTMQQPQMTGVMLVNNWTGDVNDILDKIRINSIVLSNEHKKTYFLLSSRIKWFRVPVIFLSALGSVFGIGLSPYLPQLLISEICSVMSLVVGLIGSIELFLAISTKMESELVQSKELYLLAIEIQKTLLLDIENRNGDGMAYLEDKFNVYSKLIENSYLLECKIMDELTPLPNEFQSKIPAKHSNKSVDTPGPNKMPVRRSKQAILDINMMRKRQRQVAPDSPPAISPSTSDTNKPMERADPDIELPRPISTQRHLRRMGGSNHERQMVVSRRSLLRMVASDPPRNSMAIPPLNDHPQPPIRNSIQEDSRMMRAMQPIPIETVLPEFQAVSNVPSPIRRCMTSESKLKSIVPHTHSYVDLQTKDTDPRSNEIPSFLRQHRSHVPDEGLDIFLDIESQDIQHALLDATPQISDNQLHIT